MDNFYRYTQYLKTFFTKPTTSVLEVNQALAQLGALALQLLEQGHTEEELCTEWRTLQSFFYHNQESYHLCWPQEDSLYSEALKLTGQEEPTFYLADKQPTLF